MSVKYYKPTASMVEFKVLVSTENLAFHNQYIKRVDYETAIRDSYDLGFEHGANEKQHDYQAAKEQRVYQEKKARNSTIVHVKLALQKLENL